jgi:hypothetical protein
MQSRERKEVSRGTIMGLMQRDRINTTNTIYQNKTSRTTITNHTDTILTTDMQKNLSPIALTKYESNEYTQNLFLEDPDQPTTSDHPTSTKPPNHTTIGDLTTTTKHQGTKHITTMDVLQKDKKQTAKWAKFTTTPAAPTATPTAR